MKFDLLGSDVRSLAFAAALMAATQTTPTVAQDPFGLLSTDKVVLASAVSDDEGAESDGEETEEEEEKTVPLADYEKLLERVNDIEDSWTKYQDKLADDSAAKKKKSSWKMSGRVHLDNWYFGNENPGTNFLETGDVTDDPEDRWDFRRIRLEFSGEVPNNMIFRTQIDFNNPAVAEMKDVYMGFTNLPNNQELWIGNQKRPIGLDHLNSSRHNVFMERPLAVETFNEDARRLGIQMHGHTDDFSYGWHYGAFLLENLNTDGRYRGDVNEAGFYGRLVANPWYDDISGGRGYYHFALVGSLNNTDGDGQIDNDQNANQGRFRTRPLARSDSRWWNTGRIGGADHYQQFGYESMLNIGAFQVTSEYFGTTLQRDPFGAFASDDLFFHGGYIFASYFLTGEHIPYNRKAGTIDRVKPFENFFLVDRCRGGTGKGLGALAIALRYDYLDLTDSDIQGGRGWAMTAGLNWYWTAYSKIQTNFIWGDIRDAGEDQASSPATTGVGGDFTILGMRYMIDY